MLTSTTFLRFRVTAALLLVAISVLLVAFSVKIAIGIQNDRSELSTELQMLHTTSVQETPWGLNIDYTTHSKTHNESIPISAGSNSTGDQLQEASIYRHEIEHYIVNEISRKERILEALQGPLRYALAGSVLLAVASFLALLWSMMVIALSRIRAAAAPIRPLGLLLGSAVLLILLTAGSGLYTSEVSMKKCSVFKGGDKIECQIANGAIVLGWLAWSLCLCIFTYSAVLLFRRVPITYPIRHPFVALDEREMREVKPKKTPRFSGHMQGGGHVAGDQKMEKEDLDAEARWQEYQALGCNLERPHETIPSSTAP